MKRLIILFVVVPLFFQGCDLVDGTGIENPNLPIDEAMNQPNIAKPWVNGLNEQIATVFNQFLTTAELATDNYINVQTYFNQNVDNGTYRDVDTDFDNAQQEIAALREQAEYGLETVLESDTAAKGDSLEAEMHFYKGIANLLAGELFTALPPDAEAAAVPPSQHFETAVNDFTNAINVNPNAKKVVGYYLALARAHYNLSNRTEAVNAANKAIAADPNGNFVRFVQFDGVNGPANTFQDAVYDRGGFDDLQPLPRLDFLDPKYGSQGAIESPVPLLKIEEAHLILAEAQLSDNDLSAAQGLMKDVLAVVDGRPTRDFNESSEDRQNAKLGENHPDFQRPDSSIFEVRASEQDPYKLGLVLDRTGSTTVPTISGTSVTEAEIDALANPIEALSTLYLLRQEIFFGEGRRMVDLGIKWPVSENEALNNKNITSADREATIPDYLPSAQEMDAYTVQGNQVTITFNLNTILANERGNKFSN